MRGAVVLVNWHGDEDICRIARLLTGGDDELMVVVVDNSADGVLRQSLLETGLSGAVILVEPGVNLGFGAAANLGARRALGMGAEGLLFLNPDTHFDPATIRNLFDRLGHLDRTGVYGPTIRNMDGSLQSRGGVVSRWSLGVREAGDKTPAGADGPHFVTGACLLVTRSTVERCGLFDERYFMYWEDVDLGARVRAHGLRVVVDDELDVFHERSTTHARAGCAIDGYQAKGSVIYALSQGLSWMPGLVMRLAGRVAVRLLRGHWSNARAVVSGAWAGVREAARPARVSLEVDCR